MLEWYHQGFTPTQLWINYIAFLPMPWLLLGLCALARPHQGFVAYAGALLYGVAFVYFAHSTLFALREGIPTYEALWTRLGGIYTFHGGLMVAGGLLFAVSQLFMPSRQRRTPLLLFLAGILLNLLLWLVPAPEILQTLGSTLRNLGLMLMGGFLLSDTLARTR